MEVKFQHALYEISAALPLMGNPCRSKFYQDVRKGLTVKPISIGGRRMALPAAEIEQLNAAKIAGATEDELRALVDRLHAQRATLAK
jgi:prophage regulatory protein